MPNRILFAAALLAIGTAVSAQNPRVLLDTDRGPLLLELDAVRAPNTSANFLRYVDERVYDNTLIHRVVKNFIVQGGGFKADTTPVTVRAAIASERNNGLLNTPGTISMALTGSPPNVNSATSDFFFNTGTNTQLDPNFTVFGRLVFGTKVLADINESKVFTGDERPIRMPLLRRAVRVAANEFPILPIHSGTWYDPAKSGTGFTVMVSQTDGSTTGPILVATWYTFFEGKQIWASGVVPFAWGASQVEVPLQISTGGQFGDAFQPGQVTSDPAWGRLTLRFAGCGTGTFSYTSSYGNGTLAVRSLTQPTETACVGN
jgi:peptidyl-prolyl cis-trans isomerase A (cyclophilin A)